MSVDRVVPLVLFMSAVCLGLGVFLPVVEVRNFAIFSSRFSIMEAAAELIIDAQYLLGFVVIVFSIVFPLGKIIVASLIWLRQRNGASVSIKWFSRLEFLSRWSCADVLLVALAVVVAKASGIAGATMEIGMWFFAAAIPLTAYATHRLKKFAGPVQI